MGSKEDFWIALVVECFGTVAVIEYFLKLWLGVSKGMLSVKYFRSNNACFVSVELHGDHMTHNAEVNLATLSFVYITRFYLTRFLPPSAPIGGMFWDSTCIEMFLDCGHSIWDCAVRESVRLCRRGICSTVPYGNLLDCAIWKSV